MEVIINLIEAMVVYGQLFFRLPVGVLGSLTLIALGLKGISVYKHMTGIVEVIVIVGGAIFLFMGIDGLIIFFTQ